MIVHLFVENQIIRDTVYSVLEFHIHRPGGMSGFQFDDHFVDRRMIHGGFKHDLVWPFGTIVYPEC